MDKYVVDHKYGGFMCNTDRDGTNITQNKTAWYEGRGIWVYSFLYNKLKKDPEYLEIAGKSVEFILKNEPSGDNLWPGSFSREGKPIGDPPNNIYGDLFVANGLSEYSQASGEEKYWDKAKEILTSLFFGAKIPKEHQIGHGFSSIDKEILKGMDSASRELIKHEYLKILEKDIATVFKAISSHYRTAEIEALIKGLKTEKREKKKNIRANDVVTVVYQTEENKILRTMIDYLKSKGIIYFVRIHDAVIYLDLKNIISEQEMGQYLLEKTGYTSSATQDDDRVETLCKVMGVDIKSCGLIVKSV